MDQSAGHWLLWSLSLELPCPVFPLGCLKIPSRSGCLSHLHFCALSQFWQCPHCSRAGATVGPMSPLALLTFFLLQAPAGLGWLWLPTLANPLNLTILLVVFLAWLTSLCYFQVNMFDHVFLFLESPDWPNLDWKAFLRQGLENDGLWAKSGPPHGFCK